MHTSARSEALSGLRLMHLIQTRMFDIAKAEQRNTDKMCLYATGNCWAAFNHSAYQLKKIFPGIPSFVITHPGLSLSVVGVSLPAESLNEYRRNHLTRHEHRDYVEFAAPSIDALKYHTWHSERVEQFHRSRHQGSLTLK